MRDMLWATTIAFVLTASAAYADTIIGPNGKQLDVAKCKMGTTDCFRQATNICGGPYQVLDSESHAGGLLADILPGPITWYSMAFQCGPSDGQMPTFQFRGAQWHPPSTASCTVSGQSIFCWHS